MIGIATSLDVSANGAGTAYAVVTRPTRDASGGFEDTVAQAPEQRRGTLRAPYDARLERMLRRFSVGYGMLGERTATPLRVGYLGSRHSAS